MALATFLLKDGLRSIIFRIVPLNEIHSEPGRPNERARKGKNLRATFPHLRALGFFLPAVATGALQAADLGLRRALFREG